MDRDRKVELYTHIILWAFIFIVPVAMDFLRNQKIGETMEFSEAVSIWKAILPYFAVFLVHDLLLFRLLKNRKPLYFVLTGCLILLFGVYVFTKPRRNFEPPGLMNEARKERLHEFEMRPRVPEDTMRMRSDFRKSMPPSGQRGPLSPEVFQFFIGIALILANLGVKTYFYGVRTQRRNNELEKENLDQQLTYLRYQINPHFFMNTLNNIHALVDIDPEQAKESIVELSKLMRYILYEGSKPTIPLEKETEFLKHYLGLMKMRYSDKVRIDAVLPESVPGIEVPPLVFVSFVENAFKHGVSYQSESFIDVNMKVEDNRLVFKCSNSKQDKNQDKASGIGLANVRKRLDLLYGDDYRMDIKDADGVYDIVVEIPLSFER